MFGRYFFWGGLIERAMFEDESKNDDKKLS